jgi:hypothetical protein
MTRIRQLLSVAGLAAAVTAPAAADTVWLRSGKTASIPIDNAKVTKVDGDELYFTTSSGREDHKPLSRIGRLRIDDEPVFDAAEEAFDKADFAAATEGYKKAAQTSAKDWIKDRSSLRLLEAADRSGNFNAAVTGFLELMRSKPGLASKFKPAVPRGKNDQIDQAITDVNKSVAGPGLKDEQKTVLLNYLVDLYTAKGDLKNANEVLQRLGRISPADVNTPEARHIQADLKLGQARQALGQKQYAQVEQIINGSGSVFTDPQQEADAMYLLADAKAATAPPTDANALKDAALAYMRVAAHFKGVPGQPHVADALLKTAAIEEKLKNLDEALAIYKQVAAEFKAGPAAATAQQNADRVMAMKQGKG